MSDCLKFEGALDDEETCFNSLRSTNPTSQVGPVFAQVGSLAPARFER
jgi:hypothetical protein